MEENNSALSPGKSGERRDFRVRMKLDAVTLMTPVGLSYAEMAADAARDGIVSRKENVEIIGDAALVERGGRITLRFDDTSRDPEAPDLTEVTFDADHPEFVTIRRYGPIITTEFFEQGARIHPIHGVSYFRHEVDYVVYTRRLENTLTADGGRLFVGYNLEYRGAAFRRAEVEIAAETVDLSFARAHRA